LRYSPSRAGAEHEIRAQRWQRFLSAVADAEPTETDLAVAAAWDDHERVPAWRMVRRLLAGQVLPAAWRLVRCLTLSLDAIGADTLIRWADSGVLDGIRTLAVSSPSLTIAAVAHACARLPELRAVELWRVPISRDELRGLTSTSGVESWVLSGYDSDVIEAVLEHNLTLRLRSLAVTSSRTSPSPWWRSPRISTISEIELADYLVDAKQVADLLHCLPAGLRGFTMRKNPDPKTLRPVLEHSFDSLERLDLSYNQLSGQLLRGQLLQSPSLRHVDLSYNRIGDGAVSHLVGHTGLESINLSGTRVTDAGLAALSGDTQLHRIDLSNTPCTSDGVAGLLASIGDGLRVLNLARTKIDRATVMRFGAELPLPNLELLDLSRSGIDGDGFVHLMTVAELPKLQTLVLTGCPIEVCVVLNPPRVRELRELWVDDTRIHIPEAGVLFDPEHLPHLESLRAGTNRFRAVSASNIAAFAARTPLVDIQLESSAYWGEDEFAAVVTACAPTLRRGHFGQNIAGLTAIARGFRDLRFPRLMELDVSSRALSSEELGWIADNDSLVELSSLKLDYQEPEDLQPLVDSPLLGTLQTLVVDGFDSDRAEQLLRASPHRSTLIDISVYGTRGLEPAV